MPDGSLESNPCVLVSCLCFGVLIVILLVYLVTKRPKIGKPAEQTSGLDLTPSDKIFDGTYEQVLPSQKIGQKVKDDIEVNEKVEKEKAQKDQDKKTSKQPHPRHNKSENRERN